MLYGGIVKFFLENILYYFQPVSCYISLYLRPCHARCFHVQQIPFLFWGRLPVVENHWLQRYWGSRWYLYTIMSIQLGLHEPLWIVRFAVSITKALHPISPHSWFLLHVFDFYVSYFRRRWPYSQCSVDFFTHFTCVALRVLWKGLHYRLMTSVFFVDKDDIYSGNDAHETKTKTKMKTRD